MVEMVGERWRDEAKNTDKKKKVARLVLAASYTLLMLFHRL